MTDKAYIRHLPTDHYLRDRLQLPIGIPKVQWDAAKPNPKYMGVFYTPAVIAEFLADWAVREDCFKILEPSAGNGEIVEAVVRRMGNRGHITAIELSEDDARKVAARGGPHTTVVSGDFFAWYSKNRPDGAFDAVIGNPPFIRYQQFTEEHRTAAFTLMKEEGLHPSRLTNAWLPFVVVATRALRLGGRLALVLPAELLQVGYAAGLREYLARKYSHLTIVTFRRLVFPKIQEETLLLLGVREESPNAQISFRELDGLGDLPSVHVNGTGRIELELDHAKEKWTQYYLSPAELALIRDIEKADAFCRLGELAEIDVGIVTGRNDFFVLTKQEAEARGLAPWCLPLVGRSNQIPGLVLRTDEWQRLADGGAKCFLLQLGDRNLEDLTVEARAYVKLGEKAKYHEGYKCRVRMPHWWDVPSLWAPDAFLLRQIHEGPRIIHNPGGILCTDTIHRVRVRPDVSPQWLAAASLNSMAFAFAELRGRSYGGGVLELEPTEAESLPFPKPGANLDLDMLDTLVRNGNVEKSLNQIDRLVLGPAGLNQQEIAMLREIWRKLYMRRSHRKHRYSA